MKKEIIKTLTKDFEAHANKTANDIEFWLARDLQHLLGYAKWDNFLKVISKAKTACETAGHEVADHFADVGKMVYIGSGTEREIKDFMLTRFACYLIAQNGDPQKEAIAFVGWPEQCDIYKNNNVWHWPRIKSGTSFSQCINTIKLNESIFCPADV